MPDAKTAVDTVQRTVDPLYLKFTVEFSTEDLDAAFTNQSDPDDELYYKVFSSEWYRLEPWEQLAAAAQVARLAAGDSGKAKKLNLTSEQPAPKR